MKRLLLVLFIALATMAQAQDPPPEHLTERGREIVTADPHAFCMAYEPVNEHAHQCGCTLVCSSYTDPDTGEQYQRANEDPNCIFYCAGSRRCICHADQSCPDPNMERPR